MRPSSNGTRREATEWKSFVLASCLSDAAGALSPMSMESLLLPSISLIDLHGIIASQVVVTWLPIRQDIVRALVSLHLVPPAKTNWII